jgi:phosphatidylglycerol:prolipoprotein diacylglycerol transferase
VAPLASLHPVQLYEAGFLFALGAALHVLYAKEAVTTGRSCSIYLLGYALGRTVVEEFRGDASRGWFWPEVLGQSLTYSQGISALIAVAAVVVFGVIAPRAPSNQIRGPVA